MPHRAPGSPANSAKSLLSGKTIRYYRPNRSADIKQLIDEGVQAFNAARLGQACRIFTDNMLQEQHDITVGLTMAGARPPARVGERVIERMGGRRFDLVISTGANQYHDLHYALNFTLYRRSPFLGGGVFYQEGVIRIYG